MKKATLDSIIGLTKRNILLFLKNKIVIFFSLLAPLLILVIYILFMGDLQETAIRNQLGNTIDVSSKTIIGLLNSWMVAGVIGIACLTVALNSMLVVITDKEKKIINDFTATPLKPLNLLLSYFFASFILTFCLCFVLLIGCLIFLSISTGVLFTISDFALLVLILLLSCLSSVILLMCIVIFFKTNTACTAFSGVFSALIGFLVGAYLPISMLPESVQYFSSLLPGSHSIGLFRNVILERVLEEGDIPPKLIEIINNTYSAKLNMFGTMIDSTAMFVFISLSIIVFFLVYLLLDKIRKRLDKH